MEINRKSLLEARELSFAYPMENPSLQSISFQIYPGDFAILTGCSGSGKTTLLRLCSGLLAPEGDKSGELLYDDKSYEKMDMMDLVGQVGFVMQNPESQIVTDRVFSELRFGLENLGYSSDVILRRVGEMVDFFSMGKWYDKATKELSGGQMQMLNLAAVMAMNPTLLILDEPTSQLDPVGRTNFISMLRRINEELGVTILMSEHRLDDVIRESDMMYLLENGRLTVQGKGREFAKMVVDQDKDVAKSLPLAARIFKEQPTPLTIQEGRQCLQKREISYKLEWKTICKQEEIAIQCKGVSFRYERKDDDVLKNLNFTVNRGQVVSLVGGNGSGKSTLLRVLAGMRRPIAGKIKLQGTVSMLSQNPRHLFVENTVKDELGGDEELANQFRLLPVWNRHPFDLSGGEMQRLGLAKVAKQNPDILLLDEPTKGMDATCKEELMMYIKQWKREGKTILLVSHDMEFCASICDEIHFLFHHQIVYSGESRAFFQDNMFYTTMAARMCKGFIEGAVTTQDVIDYAKTNLD